MLQGDLEAIGHECDTAVRFDPFIRLMINRTDRQVVLEFLDLDQWQTEDPELCRIAPVRFERSM